MDIIRASAACDDIITQAAKDRATTANTLNSKAIRNGIKNKVRRAEICQRNIIDEKTFSLKTNTRQKQNIRTILRKERH